jgi:hypothetical protein
MYTTNYLIYFLIFLSIPMQIMCEKTTINHTITIFVHGTFPARKFLQYTPIRSLLYCPQGLSLAKNLPQNYHFHKIAQGCVNEDPQLYSLHQFYIFGWKSEYINNATRMQAAANLVKQLQILVNNYNAQHNIIPKIQLIGYSHGGNVALNTAHYLPLKIKDKPIEIEVWLFATPVQQINQALVNSCYFTKVYSIYSKKDWLQRMDPQGLQDKKYKKKYFWSDRIFDPTYRCIQVSLTINNKSIGHTYYRCIFKYFPRIKNLIEKESQNLTSSMITVDFKT